MWWGLSTARTGEYKKGDVILVRYEADATPLAEKVFDLLIDKGFNVIPRISMSPSMDVSFYGKGNDQQLEFIPAGEEELYKSMNGLISLIAPASLTHLAQVNPARIGKATIARKFIRDIFNDNEQKGTFGWTLCMYPTKALAESANISLDEYAEQIKQACFLHEETPSDHWDKIFKDAEEVKKWLNAMDVKEFHVGSESTDLYVTPGEQRQWLGISGHNIPSFEIFLSPDWRGTRGIYYADQPSFRSGNYVEGIRLEFKDGVAVSSTAKEGADFVAKQLAMDEGAARLGEFSLTDKRFSRINAFMANTLFDENYGGEYGNCHVAVGASYADTYAGDQSKFDQAKKDELGFNDSALHWDLVNTEKKTVTAHMKDGSTQVIYEDGLFKL